MFFFDSTALGWTVYNNLLLFWNLVFEASTAYWPTIAPRFKVSQMPASPLLQALHPPGGLTGWQLRGLLHSTSETRRLQAPGLRQATRWRRRRRWQQWRRRQGWIRGLRRGRGAEHVRGRLRVSNGCQDTYQYLPPALPALPDWKLRTNRGMISCSVTRSV